MAAVLMADTAWVYATTRKLSGRLVSTSGGVRAGPLEPQDGSATAEGLLNCDAQAVEASSVPPLLQLHHPSDGDGSITGLQFVALGFICSASS